MLAKTAVHYGTCRPVRRRLAGLVVAILVGTAIAALSPPKIAAAARTITVDPSSDLLDGSVVQVYGSGFPYYDPLTNFVFIAQCPPGAGMMGSVPDDAEDCNTSNGTSGIVSPDGTFFAFDGVTVHRIIDSPTFDQVDCALVACTITAFEDVGTSGGDRTARASAPISFDPMGPPNEYLDVDAEITQSNVAASSGIVTLSGKVTCSKLSQVSVGADLRQRAGRGYVTGSSRVSGEPSFFCPGPGTQLAWTLSVVGENGIFKSGSTDVRLRSFGTDGPFFDVTDTDVLNLTIKLSGKK
jgi:hypothetical protein